MASRRVRTSIGAVDYATDRNLSPLMHPIMHPIMYAIMHSIMHPIMYPIMHPIMHPTTHDRTVIIHSYTLPNTTDTIQVGITVYQCRLLQSTVEVHTDRNK